LTDTILFQEPGVTIAYDDQAHTLAPYGRSVRPNGDVNHGFTDLRDRPELVSVIPEARDEPGLQNILLALNRKGSHMMSLGCERGLPLTRESATPPISIKSYTTVVFRDLEANQAKENLIALAHDIWNRFKQTPAPGVDRVVELELVVEPLKALFHIHDAFALDLGLVSHGRSEEEAKETYEWLASSVAAAIDLITRR
jgi:hypothetical protein